MSTTGLSLAPGQKSVVSKQPLAGHASMVPPSKKGGKRKAQSGVKTVKAPKLTKAGLPRKPRTVTPRTEAALRKCNYERLRRDCEEKYLPYYYEHGWDKFCQKYPRMALRRLQQIHPVDPGCCLEALCGLPPDDPATAAPTPAPRPPPLFSASFPHSSDEDSEIENLSDSD